jgi:hypothetical protein
LRLRYSPPWLEELDRVTRGILDDNLRAARPGHDVIRAELHPSSSQALDLGLEISNLEVDSVPAAWYLTPS